ncbi:MAG: IS630 family transposase [archaeon]
MKKYKVTLTEEERLELTTIVQKGKHRSQKVLNVLILINCDEGEFQKNRSKNESIADILQISMRKIDRVKKCFVEEGLEVALNGTKGQRLYEKKADGDFEAHLVALSCSEPPEGFIRWSLRLLADRVVELNYVDKISHETIRRVPKKNEIKPWRKQGWVIPPDQNSNFVAQMEMVLDVYKRPYDPKFPVICMDESPKQLIKETRQSIQAYPGSLVRYDYEYERSGVCNIFLASEPLTGQRLVKITERKTKRDWATYIEEIADKYDLAEKITLVMDNFITHRPGSFYEVFLPEKAKSLWDRFQFIFTPKHGSWLNMAEIELNVLSGQCLNRRIDNLSKLAIECEAWQKHRNNKNAKINWQFTSKDARIKLRRLYPTLQG